MTTKLPRFKVKSPGVIEVMTTDRVNNLCLLVKADSRIAAGYVCFAPTILDKTPNVFASLNLQTPESYQTLKNKVIDVWAKYEKQFQPAN